VSMVTLRLFGCGDSDHNACALSVGELPCQKICAPF
jgi:hypothetical protein